MNKQPILINGKWTHSPEGTKFFSAIDPSTGTALNDQYPISRFSEIDAAVQAAHMAAEEMRELSPDTLAEFLEAYADNIESRMDSLVSMAAKETALPEYPRLKSIELPRTTDQLRQAAFAVRDRTWCHAVLDTSSNIRSKHGPLGGPIVIFGPNNFPFAFNPAAGGDFAAAISAGNPVIAKAHPGHPGTSRMFAEAALESLTKTGLPQAALQMFYDLSPEDGIKLITHPQVGAVAFTGSRRSGMALKAAAETVGKPIYLEMSSSNPVFLLPGALGERCAVIAGELFSSCTLASGQFCTKPGLVIFEHNKAGKAFIEEAVNIFLKSEPGTLLGSKTRNAAEAAVKMMRRYGAKVIAEGKPPEDPAYSLPNRLLMISGTDFLKNPIPFQVEAFGPSSLLVTAESQKQMLRITDVLEGSLTGAIYSHSGRDDDEEYERLAPRVRKKVGRLLNDKMPTGVAVTPAMNHGGPFPAAGHPGFTSVGIPASFLRFTALHCYDSVRPHRLPSELRDKNPTGKMWRWIDGEWTQRDV